MAELAVQGYELKTALHNASFAALNRSHFLVTTFFLQKGSSIARCNEVYANPTSDEQPPVLGIPCYLLVSASGR
jgi:hypothetical protein